VFFVLKQKWTQVLLTTVYLWLILNPSWNSKSGQLWVNALLEMEQDPEDNYIIIKLSHWQHYKPDRNNLLTTYNYQASLMSSQTMKKIFSKPKAVEDILPLI